MRDLGQAIKKDKCLRVIGFDDAPFKKPRNTPVNVCGVVCAGTRFEGMFWGELTKDGDDATEALFSLLSRSKFYPQVHLVLLDGIAMGGFNIVKLKTLSTRLNLPCLAVMRKRPDMEAIDAALRHFDDYSSRLLAIGEAGPVHELSGFVFQAAGCSPSDAATALALLTDRGKVPEALRLAHLIGAAVKTGESGSRA